MLRGQRKQFVALIGLFVLLALLLNAIDRAGIRKAGSATGSKRKSDQFIVDASGCQILDLKAFSASAREFTAPPQPLHCSKKYFIEHVCSDFFSKFLKTWFF
jgi:hypothetical protein